jgi:hypothetical protein
MFVVETFELAKGVEQVSLVPDQHSVQQLTAARLHPPFHDRVHTWHPDPAEHDFDTSIREGAVALCDRWTR